MTKVEAPGRLHFGLMSLPIPGRENWPEGLPVRLFGGAGLMIQSPGVEVVVAPAKVWETFGPSADRALHFGRRFIETLPCSERQAFSIEVRRTPPEHCGLGSGTSLALSVAKAIAVELGHRDLPAVELAVRVGRGERSAVGIHGFEHGGFLVEAGKLPDDRIAPLIGRYEFPSEWRIVLLRPEAAPEWHGDKERRAFINIASNNATESMCRILLTGVIPALLSKNLCQFGEALYEFNLLAGIGFAVEQGGAWANTQSAQIVGLLRADGVHAVGQSSWGPTVFAIVDSEGEAQAVKKKMTCRSALPDGSISITAGSNKGFVTNDTFGIY